MGKIQDINPKGKNPKLNLKEVAYEKEEKESIQKNKNFIYKKNSSVTEIKDINKDEEKKKYIYIKGTKFNPPRFLGSLVRLGIVGIVIVLIINGLNIYFIGKTVQKDVSSSAYEGYSLLVNAGKSATKIEFDKSLDSFNKASAKFSEAEKTLWFISTDKSFYSQNAGLGPAINNLITSGKYFAKSGNYFTEALEEFNKLPLYFVSKNNPETGKTVSITEGLKKGLEKTELAIKEISSARDLLTKVKADTLPKEIRDKIALIKSNVDDLTNILESTSTHFPAILKLLGDSHPHRYLILLQNNDEIRPTGGFIGSYIILDMNDGYIENMTVNDVYDIDGAYGGIITPPDELKDFTNNWRFRDSNYSPDFPTSAAKAKWMLQEEGGPGVDTVIAINQGLLKNLLDITGPVQVGNFGKLNSENYNLLLTYVIEGKIWGAEDPKHILKMFIPAFKDQILKEENIGKITSQLYKALKQKHIMMWSSDTEIEGLFDAFGISGRMYLNKADEDYLSVINVSQGWNKSEKFMEENITHNTQIDKYGSLTDQIIIMRSHQWDDKLVNEWKKTLKKYNLGDLPDWLIDVLGRGNNKVGVRIYVPDGSIFLESSDKSIEKKFDNDTKKTYFYTKMETSAGKSTSVSVKYKLPFLLKMEPIATYKLIVEKQPGSRGSIFTKVVSTDAEIKNFATYPSESRLDENGNIIYATNLVYDRYFSGIWGK